MKKSKRRQKPARISMVERAIIASRWLKASIDAHIHALIGSNSDKLVDLSGRMFYVALGAAMAERIDPSDPDLRIIRGAVNAVYDQAGDEQIRDIRRASIISGLHAVGRLSERVQAKSLIDSACNLELMLRSGDVMYSDIEAIINASA